MKKCFFAMVMVMALAFLTLQIGTPMLSLAQELEPTKIEVSGMAEISVLPNMAIIQIGIENVNPDAKVAQQENATKFALLKKYLQSFPIKETDIKTTNYNMYKEYDYGRYETTLKGYKVVNQIEIKTKELSRLGELISGLVEHNVNNMQGVQFLFDDSKSVYLKALAQAVVSAKQKAEVLLGENNFVLKEISEFEQYYQPMLYRSMDSMKASEAASVYPGELTIKATIKATFEQIIA